MERALERRPGLADRLFTERERVYAASRPRPAQHLAARFCAKEAVSKALAMEVFRPLDELRGDARANAERLPGAPAEPFAASGLGGAVVVVDAILGTGFTGKPRGNALEAIEAINAADAAAVAADVPSGIDASTGVA